MVQFKANLLICFLIIFILNRSTKSQVFPLMFGSQKIPVYCHMGNFGCGDGGWTLAMKIDGNKKTFHYDSHFWNDRKAYNLAGGKTGFDLQETKLPTYWNTSFSKICLGMKIGQQTNFTIINKQANSLYSLIADGQYRATSLGRNTWKTLIGSQASLQRNCNKEGSMLWVLLLPMLKQESAFLVMSKMTATAVTPESGLVQEAILMTPTRVEMTQGTQQIMETNKSKPWVISWYSDMNCMMLFGQTSL